MKPYFEKKKLWCNKFYLDWVSEELSQQAAQENMVKRNWEFRQDEQWACKKKMAVTHYLKITVASLNETG